jgi:hypothetical protein
MYNERERLMHHQQLLSPASAAADLQLLADRSPKHPQLDEFSLSPTRHHDAILLELLKVADRGTIVENRLRYSGKQSAQTRTANEPEPAPVPDAEPEPVPAPPAAKKKAARASRKKTNTPT